MAGKYGFDDGTAVYWKCECGAGKVTEHPLQWVIWNQAIVHVLGEE